LSSSQTRGRYPTCPLLGHRRCRLARQPTRCRLLLGLGCPASPSIGGGGDGVSSNVVLPPRREDVVDSAAGGRAVGRHCHCRTAGKEYHVVAAVEGHELKTPETEHRPGLERLLETAHLELDGKLFVNTQQAPTWRANCRRFEPGGSLDRRVNCRRVPQPRWVGARRSAKGGRSRRETGVKGETRGLRVCPAPRSGALAVGGYKRPRERERAALRERRPVLPRAANPL
jgi:hypothetical protein